MYCFFKTLCFFAGLKDLQQALVLGEAKNTAKKKLDTTLQNKGNKGKASPEQEAHANRETALLWNSCGLTLNAMGCNQEAIQCYQEGMCHVVSDVPCVSNVSCVPTACISCV